MKKRQGDQTIKRKLNKILEKSRLENTRKVSKIYTNDPHKMSVNVCTLML